jgi:CHC2-type zinc finger protein
MSIQCQFGTFLCYNGSKFAMNRQEEDELTEELYFIPDKNEIRRRLPLSFAANRLDIAVSPGHNALCPFHVDTNPSFGVYVGDDGTERWSCFPCGKSGDVFDLIQELHNCSFPEAIETAWSFLQDLPPGYEPPPTEVKKNVGPVDWQEEVQSARLLAANGAHAGILSARVGLEDVHNPEMCFRWDRYLRDTWGWGINPLGEILMPHWDKDNILTACKTRTNTGKGSLPGSKYTSLYGAWLGRHRHRDVLLTEGESDCVFAAFHAREEQVNIDVFALPSGANDDINPDWLEFLKGPGTVYLCFDPDRVGVEATWKWIDALEGSTIKVCCLPEGKDLRDAKPKLKDLLTSARLLLDKPDTIAQVSGGYFREGKDGEPRRVTSWFVEPTAQLAEGDPGYDVVLHYRGTQQRTVLRLSDLSGTREIKRWCNRHGILFTGREDDLARVAEYVAWKGSVVPEIYQTDQVGLAPPPETYGFAGPSVVFPHGYVGKMPWRYVPSARAADVSDKVLLPTTGPFMWSWLEDFLKLNRPDVMQPFLAWLVASARRPTVTEFPLFFIGGSSGVGKSTLARLGLRLLGSQIELDLGSVTPFILNRTLASTSSLPVFTDEWTKLSRKDTREAFQGVIPVLYTGGTAERGQADLSSQVYVMSAPTVIAGEDTFMLDREIDRTITVGPSRAGQDHDALGRIITAPLERFGQLLHTWLTTREALPDLSSAANTRPEYNRNILIGGWQTLLALMEDASHSDPTVPADFPDLPDLSSIDAPRETENVYETALLEGVAMRDPSGHPVVWGVETGTWVRFRILIGLLRSRNVDLQLPGGERAMKTYFEERYGVIASSRTTPPGGFTSVHAAFIPDLDLGFNTDPRANFNFS